METEAQRPSGSRVLTFTCHRQTLYTAHFSCTCSARCTEPQWTGVSDAHSLFQVASATFLTSLCLTATATTDRWLKRRGRGILVHGFSPRLLRPVVNNLCQEIARTVCCREKSPSPHKQEAMRAARVSVSPSGHTHSDLTCSHRLPPHKGPSTYQ